MPCSFFNLLKQEPCSLLALLLVIILWTRSEVSLKKKKRSIAKNLISKKKKNKTWPCSVFKINSSLFWGNHEMFLRKVLSWTLAKEMYHGGNKGQDSDHLTITTMTNHFPLVSQCLQTSIVNGSEVLGTWSRKHYQVCFYWYFYLQLEKGGLGMGMLEYSWKVSCLEEEKHKREYQWHYLGQKDVPWDTEGTWEQRKAGA